MLGAGYGGLTAALRLALHHQVALVAPETDLAERVRLHELAAGVGAPSATHRPGCSRTGTGTLSPAPRRWTPPPGASVRTPGRRSPTTGWCTHSAAAPGCRTATAGPGRRRRPPSPPTGYAAAPARSPWPVAA